MIYQNEQLREISFPLGGIGTGCIGLAGNGALRDWEIYNRPNKGTINPYTFFLIRAERPDGTAVTKILQGDETANLSGLVGRIGFSGFGLGLRPDTMCGFPHFASVVFDGSFPIATLTFCDPDFPAQVVMEAYNPLIPQDSKNSSLPAAIFRIHVRSQAEGVRYTVLLCGQNPFLKTSNHPFSKEGLALLKLLHAECDKSDPSYGDLTLAVQADEVLIQPYWYRSGWMGKEGVATFWRELSEGSLRNREYTEPATRDVGCVGASQTVGAGENALFRFCLSWSIPNCAHYWDPQKAGVTWKNYYATLFEDSVASARYVMAREDELYTKTKAFCDLLQDATLDSAVIDAISSTLSVLKSPTVLRLTDGTLWGWEGVYRHEGSCEGSCTHVWSYAYALCFLFPDLERSLRQTEFHYDTDENGKMTFRTTLPLSGPRWNHRACVDGQMASVIKTYREWKIGGDDDFLRAHWQTVKSLLSYAWSEQNPDAWDRDHDGVLEGRQHHTLDMELFGPSAWLQGLYLAALKAGAEMADFLGDIEAAQDYRTLFERGYAFTSEQLFNGSYFIQKIDLRDRSPIERFNCPEYWNEERKELKFQIGEGCEIDQLLGQWHASLCGLGDIFDPKQRKNALKSMYENLYKPNLRTVANMWRIFAVNDEGGAIICEYPDSVYRPVIPIPYAEECMTGFEYAFAGLLIREGFEEEGLSIVRAVRDRYDGQKRNPWNELECGSNYARAMASFALLPIFAGMEFDVGRGHVGFVPLHDGTFRCPWSLGKAWGGFERTEERAKLTLCGGSLSLCSIRLGGLGRIRSLRADGKEIPFQAEKDTLRFEKITVIQSLEATV